MSAQTELTRPSSIRYPYLDWVRIIGIFAVFLYHSGRAFDFEDWHVKNLQLSEGLAVWLGFLIGWIMPLMFVVSGVSTYLSLRSRTPGRFLKDRTLRILVPLIGMGILIFGPYQIYLERLTHGQFTGSLLAFLPHYFDGWYFPGTPGNFAWMGVHLWYLLVLFLWSLLLLPVFLLLKRESLRESLSRRLAFMAKPGLIFLLALPLALFEWAIQGMMTVGGFSLFMYIFYLLIGYLLMALPPLMEGARRHGAAALVGGLIVSGLRLVAYLLNVDLSWPVLALWRSVNAWLWILALIGLCSSYLNVETRFSRYANEAVLPFYILHQPVILLVAFTLLNWAIPPGLKYGVFLVVCFPIIMVVYEFLVRRNNVGGFLFGLKLRPVTRRAASPRPARAP